GEAEARNKNVPKLRRLAKAGGEARLWGGNAPYERLASIGGPFRTRSPPICSAVSFVLTCPRATWRTLQCARSTSSHAQLLDHSSKNDWRRSTFSSSKKLKTSSAPKLPDRPRRSTVNETICCLKKASRLADCSEGTMR